MLLDSVLQPDDFYVYFVFDQSAFVVHHFPTKEQKRGIFDFPRKINQFFQQPFENGVDI